MMAPGRTGGRWVTERHACHRPRCTHGCMRASLRSRASLPVRRRVPLMRGRRLRAADVRAAAAVRAPGAAGRAAQRAARYSAAAATRPPSSYRRRHGTAGRSSAGPVAREWQPRTDASSHRARAGWRSPVASLVTAALVAIVAVLVTTGGRGRPRRLAVAARLRRRLHADLRRSAARNCATCSPASGAFGTDPRRTSSTPRSASTPRSQQSSPSLLFVGFSGRSSPSIGHAAAHAGAG